MVLKDLDEQDVEPPQLGRIFVAQIGVQEIAAFADAPGAACCGRE
jgi:hypothetical protein